MAKIASLVIAFNHARYVADLADSFRRQRDIDLLVHFADNRSEDGTAECAARALDAAGIRAVRFFHGGGEGWSGMLADAIRALPTDIDAVTLLSADDRYAGNALSRCVRVLDGDYDYPPLAVTGMLQNVSEQLEPQKWFYSRVKDGTGTYVTGDPLDILSVTGSTVCMIGVFRPEVARLAADYLEGLNYVDDAAFFAALAELRAHIIHAPIHIADYRAHPSSASRNRRLEVLADTLRVFGRLQRKSGADLSHARGMTRRGLVQEIVLTFVESPTAERSRQRTMFGVDALRQDQTLGGISGGGVVAELHQATIGMRRGAKRALLRLFER